MNRARLIILAIAVAALTACAPIAQFGRDLLDTSDGATLTYMLRTDATLPGLRFHPGDAPALGVILIARGADLTVLGVPEGVTCTNTPDLVDCRFGDVTDTTFIYLTGLNVTASVTYRREGDTRVLQAFAR